METDRASRIFKHLKSSLACSSAFSHDNVAIIDQASSWFALKIREALHILRDKLTLNAQVKHVNLKLCVIVVIFSSTCTSLEFIVHFMLKMVEATAEICIAVKLRSVVFFLKSISSLLLSRQEYNGI